MAFRRSSKSWAPIGPRARWRNTNMNRRWLVGLAVLLLLGVAAVVAIPATRYWGLGYLRKERFVEGMPTSYWVYAVQTAADPPRAHAAHVLGELGADTPAVIPALIEAVKDKDVVVRRNAVASLGKIGPQAAAAESALI